MHISSWAAMTKRHRGRQWHCRTSRTINLDYVSPPQAMQWPDDRSKHRRQWLGCGNSILRYVFPISKTCWALIGGPKTSRDTKKHCGEPGCPNDHRSQVLALRDEVIDFRFGHFSDLSGRADDVRSRRDGADIANASASFPEMTQTGCRPDRAVCFCPRPRKRVLPSVAKRSCQSCESIGRSFHRLASKRRRKPVSGSSR